MKGMLTYESGGQRGVVHSFDAQTPLTLEEGSCAIRCEVQGDNVLLTVQRGLVTVSQPGRHPSQVFGQLELRPGDHVHLGSISLSFSEDRSVAPPPAAPPEEPKGPEISFGGRRPKAGGAEVTMNAAAKRPPPPTTGASSAVPDIQFGSSRPTSPARNQAKPSGSSSVPEIQFGGSRPKKSGQEVTLSYAPRTAPATTPPAPAATPPPRQAPPAPQPAKPAPKGPRFPTAHKMLGFVPEEKRDQVFLQILMAVFLLLASFAAGTVIGLQDKVKESKGAFLEPHIRDVLYHKGQELGWDYPTLLEQLKNCRGPGRRCTERDRVLAVWWLTLPDKERQ